MKKIILTGGGSAGHVTPNLALKPYLLKNKFEIHYIGSESGIEKDIIEKEDNIKYHPVRTGKLRRYFSWKNFTDPFRVIGGYSDAKKLMKEIKPDVVFSKGGFVSVPVVAAAHKYKIPVISHESDMTPGLANKLSKRFATKLCVTFPEALEHISKEIGVFTGSPIRHELYSGNAQRARKKLNFDSKPVLLIIGGSLGSKVINEAVRSNLETLCKKFNIIHLCGKNNIAEINDSAISRSYKQFEFVKEELPDYFALSDYIISRAGSNAIHEFLALKKPMLLIPLSKAASRGDQILNAKSFEKRGYAIVLEEEKLTPSTLLKSLDYLEKDKDKLIAAMSSNKNADGTDSITKIIGEVCGI
ncbi:MAG: undecaprenyldiphospho-muramoylpentapeptide beta-N-acetylglucosaminyltransferase [Clostridia bacterium]|nr:undecaprenyldiphospho-muramoylpentapeptide beta-N-acetylglucosaminyltransferase [Clostridia bacterium]